MSIHQIKQKNGNWRGAMASYSAKHKWITYNFGKADHCDNDLSHQTKRFEWSNRSGKYRREIEDWEQLCCSCHRAKDKAQKYKISHTTITRRENCFRGHDLSIYGTIKKTSGQLVCKLCNAINQANYRKRECVNNDDLQQARQQSSI